jgi:hypothetical protein
MPVVTVVVVIAAYAYDLGSHLIHGQTGPDHRAVPVQSSARPLPSPLPELPNPQPPYPPVVDSWKSICALAHPGQDTETALGACVAYSALATSAADRAWALQTAAHLVSGDDPRLGAAYLMHAAAAGAPRSLLLLGSGTADDADLQRLGVEALIFASRGDDASIRDEALRMLSQRYTDGGLQRPELVSALVQGRLDSIPDTVDDRRYLLGFADALDNGICFTTGDALFRTADFHHARSQYGAPILAGLTVAVAGASVDWLASLGRATFEFARQLIVTGRFVEPATRYQRELARNRGRLQSAASLGSRAGARDAVSAMYLLNGCGSPESVHLIRAIEQVFEQRADHDPASEN